MTAPDGVEVLAPVAADHAHILSDDALTFVAGLEREFRDRRATILAARTERAARLAAGERPDFLPETADVRAADWRVAPAPSDLDDRRVEITGPAEPKMTINALNSGARVFMADFEDSLSPTWANIVTGQATILDAHRRTLTFTSPEGKAYRLGDEPATLLVRPRGWHLVERHVMVDGAPMSASLFDFGLFLFHGGRAALERGSGPYLYLPKLESHLEARLWNDVFIAGQQALGIPRGSIRATVLIETILAAFEMDEILFELREHAAGLNAGRWDYIFSIIKKFRGDPAFVLPDRAQVTMAVPFMRAYTPAARAHLPSARRACHRRHVRLHPQPARAGGDRQRAGQGPRGQGARVGRRLRRHLGGASRPGAGGHGGLRSRARRSTEPEGPPARGRRRERRRAARSAGAPMDGSARPACART